VLHLSADEWTAIFLTLRIAVVATLCALPFGVFAAYALARWQFPGKMLVNGIVHLPLVLPPVVTGYLLLLSFGRRGMIGAFLGWQAALLVFFFAPFLGIVMGLAQLLIHRRHEMPYGPFLCLAALGVILGWPWLWDRTISTFSIAWLVPGFVVVCLVAMFFTLLLWGFVKRLLFGRR